MLGYPGFINLEGKYRCTICGELIFALDGWWSCDCQRIGIYEHDLGAHPLPPCWKPIPEN